MTPPEAYSVFRPTGEDTAAWQLRVPDLRLVADANRFLHAVGLPGLAPRTLRTYAYDLLCAFRWLHTTHRSMTGLTGETLLHFIEHQKSTSTGAPSTINRRLALLQRFFAFLTGRPPACSAWQATGPVLFRRRRRTAGLHVRTSHRLVSPLKDQEAAAFFHTLRTARDRAITLLMWADGLRSCEVVSLGLGDVDFQTMSLKLLGKGQKERVMPLAEPVAKVLLQYLAHERPARSSPRFFVVLKGPRRGHPMTYAGLARLFRYHRATSQVAHANPHRFRHTFGAAMTRGRVPLAILAKMMGHSSAQTTLRYIQLNDHDIRHQYEQAIQTLNLRALNHDPSSSTDPGTLPGAV